MVEKTDVIQKPVPAPDELSAPFFEGARKGLLMIQRCTECGAYLAPGSRACTGCLGEALAWVPASGRGTVFTFGVMHQRYHPAFASEIPYNVAVVELEEGPRLNTNLVGVPNEEIRVGMAVEVTFDRLTDEVSIPKFRRAGG